MGCKIFEKKVVKIFGLCCGMSVSLHPQMRDSGPDNNRESLIVRCRKKKFSKKAILICTIENRFYLCKTFRDSHGACESGED